MCDKTLGGIIIGALLTGAIQFGIIQWQQHKKIKSIKAGFAAEIKNILDAAEFWETDKLIQAYTKCLSEGEPVPPEKPKTFNKEVAFKFYNNLTADIGYLPQDIVNKIVLFYGNACAILEDIENLHSTKAMNIPAKSIIEKDRDLFNQAVETGKALLKDLS